MCYDIHQTQKDIGQSIEPSCQDIDTLYSELSRLRRSSMPKAYIIKGDTDENYINDNIQINLLLLLLLFKKKA